MLDNIEEYGYTDFNTENENYSEYKLKDGTIIRTRAILLKVIKKSSIEFSLTERSFATSFSPSNLKGPAGSASLPQDLENIIESIKEQDIDILLTKERWSEYKLNSGDKISLKAILVSASLTDKYDEYGDPIYALQLQVIHKINPKKPL
jgi:hypothetical protein